MVSSAAIQRPHRHCPNVTVNVRPVAAAVDRLLTLAGGDNRGLGTTVVVVVVTKDDGDDQRSCVTVHLSILNLPLEELCP